MRRPRELPKLAEEFLNTRPGRHARRVISLLHRWMNDRGLSFRTLTQQHIDAFLERPKDSGSDRIFVLLQGQWSGQPMTRAARRRIFRTRREQKALTNAKVPIGKLNNERLVPLDDATLAAIQTLQQRA